LATAGIAALLRLSSGENTVERDSLPSGIEREDRILANGPRSVLMSSPLSRLSDTVLSPGPRPRLWLHTILVLSLLIAPLRGSGNTAQQQQQPVFEATVELVQLQVTVEDESGSFVSGLGRDDFQLWIDGTPRAVSLVYEVDLGNREEAAPVAPSKSSTSTVADLPPAGWRQFLLFFDFSFTSPRGVIAAQEAAQAFVSDVVHPNDLLSVVTYDHVAGLKLLCPFTLDRSQVNDAIGELGLSRATRTTDPVGYDFRVLYEMVAGGEEGTSGDLSLNDELFDLLQLALRSDFERYTVTAVDYVRELGKLGKMMQAARGRKHIVFFSQGFDDKVLAGHDLDQLVEDSILWQNNRLDLVDPASRFGSAELRDALDEAIEELRRADAVVHAIDTSGLGSESAGLSRGDPFSGYDIGRHHGLQGLTYLSDGTLGTLTFNTNDFVGALEALEERTSAFYVVAYNRAPEDPPVVDLKVEVSVPDAEVVSAPSRLAPPPDPAEMTPAQRQMQLAEYITKGVESEQANFSFDAIPFPGEHGITRVAVVLEIPWAQLEAWASARGDDRAEVELLGYVLEQNGQMLDFFSGGVSLDLERLRSSRFSGLPFRYYNLLWAVPGWHDVRVLLRESTVGQISAHTIECEIPDFAAEELTLSGPVFLDAEHPGMVYRGIDPVSPPEHKSGGPVAYPFVSGERELTPRALPVLSPGDSQPILLVAHHPWTHTAGEQVRLSVGAEVVDARGISRNLSRINLEEMRSDTDANSTTLLLDIHFPADLQRGTYDFRLTVAEVGGDRQVGGPPRKARRATTEGRPIVLASGQ
jgi:VWFA-related protein